MEMSEVNNRLKSFIDRIEKLNEELDDIKTDVKEIYIEAKGEGYDTKILRAVIKIRAQDQAELEQFQELLDTYMAALGGVE
jgi:uncharacterized protein (UPF0335 family)